MTQPDGLLETNILIDIMRGYNPAVSWIKKNPRLSFVIPSPVRMEMVLGTNSKREQEQVLKFLKLYPVVNIRNKRN